jgi:hypothetical protein
MNMISGSAQALLTPSEAARISTAQSDQTGLQEVSASMTPWRRPADFKTFPDVKEKIR